MSNVTFSKKIFEPGYIIKLDGEIVGSVIQAADREGPYWAWNAIVDGRFGGTAPTDKRFEACDDAKKDAKEWIKGRREEVTKSAALSPTEAENG